MTRAVWLLLLAGLILALLTTFASGQEPRARERITDQLALARICASEAGLPRRAADGWTITTDCAAIYSALIFGATQTGLSFQSRARAYSGRVFDRGRSDPRAWIAHLDPRGDAPAGWPSLPRTRREGEDVRVLPPAAWSAYRASWLALHEHAGQVVRGEITSTCEDSVSDWGGAMDRARATRIGLIPVACEGTRNDFYMRPSWIAERD